MRTMDKLYSLDGRTAIVTGASSGCGVTFARALAAAGANVVLGARRLSRLEEVAHSIEADGGVALPVQCDVSSSSEVESMVEQAWRRFGRVDVLVNNAGLFAGSGMMPEHLNDDCARQSLETNLLGTFFGCRQVGMRMLADGRGGSIINIGSPGGMSGFPDQSPMYGASKAGIVNLTQNLAASWGDRGVRVNALILGYFPSEMSQHFLAIPSGREFARGHIALGRVAKTEELIGPIVFLASDASSYVTGSMLMVDGGMMGMLGRRMPQEFYDMLAQQPGGIGRRIEPRAS